MNLYYCSSGERVSQAIINRRRSEAYRKKYLGEENQTCFECGRRAEGNAHLIPQSRAKSLKKTELIWEWENFVPMCHEHNVALENVGSPEFKKLNGYEYYLEIFRKYDLERYFKAI